MSNPRCKQCKERTEDPISVPAGKFCSMDHMIQFAREKSRKVHARKLAKAKKAESKAHKERKQAVKPKTKWLSELQALVNRYVRLRDVNDGCICCDKTNNWDGQWHAGHFFPQGRSSALRFNMWNIHKQASSCNNHLSGNLLEYKPRLIAKIGQERYDYLEAHQNDLKTYDIEWIKRSITVTKKAIKRLERRQ